jgi:CHAD domain-containing protein
LHVNRVFRSTYHDTADRRLGRSGVALRRRLENGKSTWEVELPEAPGHVAVAAPGGPAGPPPLIADLLQAIVRQEELVEIAAVQTERSDDLHAEVALDNGSVVDRFVRDGGQDEPGLIETGPFKPPAEKPSTRALIQARFEEQYSEILAHDPGTRLGDEPEALHKQRVAVRRLRALLRSAEPMLDPVWANQLREELGWLGRSLGNVRDLDVLLVHLREEVRALEGEDRSAGLQLIAALDEERTAARAELVQALGSTRYLTLLARLEEAVPGPRWVGDDIPVEELARKSFRKLAKAANALGKDATDEELHAVRIRAKRARYAAELAETIVGKPATRFVQRARELQDVIGEHQDAVVAEERLRAAATKAHTPQAAISVGRLVERERVRRRRSRARVPTAWRKLERAGRQAWR